MKINYTSEMTETEKRAIYSSINTIASTPYGTAPYLRNMGIKNYIPDRSEFSKNARSAEVIQQTEQWEDRARIQSIKYNGNEMEVTVQ